MILSDTAVRSSTAVLVLALLVFIFGVTSYLGLPRESDPDITIPNVFVSTSYRGVSSADMETSVTMEIEKRVDNLPLDSTASILTAGLLGEKYIGISVGGEEDLLADGATIHDTQSALVLEDLIGKFLMNSVNKDSK